MPIPPVKMSGKLNKMLTSKRGRQIIAAAAELFYRHGFDGVGIQEIADSVGILKGSLYHYMESKDDILFAVIYQFNLEFHKKLDELLRLPLQSPDKIKRIMRLHASFHMLNVDRALVSLNERNKLSKSRQKALSEPHSKYRGYLKGMLTDGIAQGYFDQSMDISLVCTALFSVMNFMNRWYRPDGRLAAEAIADAFCDMIFRGICTEQGIQALDSTNSTLRDVRAI